MNILFTFLFAIASAFFFLVENIWKHLEELVGSFIALILVYCTDFFHEYDYYFLVKIVTSATISFFGGMAAHLGKKYAEKHLKTVLILASLAFLCSCNMSYRISKNCTIYTQTNVAAQSQKFCLECSAKLTELLKKSKAAAKY